MREKRRVLDYQKVQTDPGVSDKRLLIIESEFGKVLSVCERTNSTLSATIRQAWDTGDLRILTKTQAARATGSHISIIGHVTQNELRRLLTDIQAANGFGNRLLWVCARRSKLLPHGGDFSLDRMDGALEQLRRALRFAHEAGEIRRSDRANRVWEDVYGYLSAGGDGLAGAVTGRSEAQTMRPSALYACLDCSYEIQPEHLWAAGSQESVNAVLLDLEWNGLMTCETHQTGGRPVQVFRAT